MFKIYKKKWTNLKWFKDENGNIVTEAFATDFWKDGLTYYKHYTIGWTTDYFMGYANKETWELLTWPFAHMIQWVFAYVRDKEGYKIPNSRNIYVMDPYTWDIINSDFADKLLPSSAMAKFWSALTNTLLIDPRLDKDVAEGLLIRFQKDKKIWLCDMKGNVVVEPFAKYILADWIYKTDKDIWIINMFNWNMEISYNLDDWVEIYQPNLNNWQVDYLIKTGNWIFTLTDIGFDAGYLNIMLELLKYQQ